ncbi:MAG: hypothetical protein LAT76_04885 [Schleiferiaceae bacterium]|nr:hypothetical protein [Schleiferiaceae bacterium]
MKKVFLLVVLCQLMAVSSFGGNQLFKKEEKKAKAFLDSCLQIHYQQQFKTKFIGTLNEFGKIHFFYFT